jgi:hypothetical protein
MPRNHGPSLTRMHGIEAWEALTVCTREGGPHVTHLAIRRAVCHTPRLTWLLLTLSLCSAASLTFAAVVGDQVELKAMQRSGVPVHHAPGGTQGFQPIVLQPILPHTRAQLCPAEP